jgi:hypothetical protein
MTRVSQVRTGANLAFLGLTWFLLFSSPVEASYKVVLKNGQTIVAKVRPISANDVLIIQAVDNKTYRISVALMDRAATLAANANEDP